MSMETEQIDQLLETLRRDCLPAGGADLISAYVSSQRQALAQVHAELAAKPADDLAKACIERLIESGAENYLEHHFVFTIDGEETARPATVTVQFQDRPSPHQLRLLAETELAGALKHLDAVVNGYGCDMHKKPGGPREFLTRHAQADQPQAQGAPDGDGLIPHFRFEDRAGNAEWFVRLRDHCTALSAQRVTGETVADPIQVEAVAITREDEDGLYLDWLLEGGISALEATGVVLLVAHGTVTDDQGSGEVYLARSAVAPENETPGTVRVTADWLNKVHRDLDACQKVIWLAGCRPRVPGGFDPAYCEDAQARLKEIDEHIARAQAKEQP